MKKILILIIVIVAIVAIPPYFIGSSAEQQTRDMYAKMDAHPLLNVSVTEYNAGWMSSNATIKVGVALPDAGEIPSFNINQSIFHGPILWKAGGFGIGVADSLFNVEFPQSFLDEVENSSGINKDTFKTALRVHFDGTVRSSFESNAFSFTENGQVDVAASYISATLTPDQKLSLTGNWDGLELVDPAMGKLTVGKLTIQSTQTLISGEMFSPYAITAGDFRTDLALIDLQAKNAAENFKMNDVFLTADSGVDAGLMEINTTFGAKSFNIMAKDYTNLIYDLTLSNLDIESIQTMGKEMSDPAVQANPMLASVKLQELLPKLVEKNPILKINQLGVTTEQGAIENTLTINVDQSVYNPANPMTLMLAAQGKANGKAPVAFFNSMGMSAQIDQMVQQNFLKLSGEELVYELTYSQGQALLNGAPIPLGGF